VDEGKLVALESKGATDQLRPLGHWHVGGLMDMESQTDGWFQGSILQSFISAEKIFDKSFIRRFWSNFQLKTSYTYIVEIL
jgi:hypothetical protein